MCTAVTYQTKDFYFGRTLDYEFTYGEQVTIVPRNFPISFRSQAAPQSRLAIIGMAHIADGYPLFYDAVNECGLCAAGLNFVGYTHYPAHHPERDNIAHFELIPWLLCQCRSLAEARVLLSNINITGSAFSLDLPPAQLHWLVADKTGALVVECAKNGLQIHEDPIGVLTNAPTFDAQLQNLQNYLSLTPRQPQNRFSPELDLQPDSRGLGAVGLPGDLSSRSRFVRAAFTKCHSRSGESEAESVSQFFHILGTVAQTRGCCEVADGQYEITAYTSCCNATRGIYYYTTYDNSRITAVHLHREDLSGKALITYPLLTDAQIAEQN